MNHKDRKLAKSFDTPGRCAEFTDTVYGGKSGTPEELSWEIHSSENKFNPPPPDYNVYFGEMHGHTNLSDGKPDIDSYFRNLRDNACLDFGAVTDHDHGGVGHPELWGDNNRKWNLIKEKVREYYESGKFTTILAYERDSYPFYNNLVIYYSGHDGELIRGVRDGEFTREELTDALARKDIFMVPHDTYSLSSGTDFSVMPLDCMTEFIEIYSRGDAAEYMGNPGFFDGLPCCEGGFFQDALRRGARMGVIGGSDDHNLGNGLILDNKAYPLKSPGLTGVWAKENTIDSIYAALRARRCFAFMGGRITVDFRINGHYMGEEFSTRSDDTLNIWYSIVADAPVRHVTIVKNCRNYICLPTNSQLIFDYRRENKCDYYYLRVELTDGRFAWSSPIWVNFK